MKNTLILIALFPCMAFAQQQQVSFDSTTAYLKVHFARLTYHSGNITSMRTDSAVFLIQNTNSLVTGDMLKARALRKKERSADYQFEAEAVTIKGKAAGELKADKMEYDPNKMQARLTGHITLSGQGTEREIGQYALVDMSDNRCRIERLR